MRSDAKIANYQGTTKEMKGDLRLQRPRRTALANNDAVSGPGRKSIDRVQFDGPGKVFQGATQVADSVARDKSTRDGLLFYDPSA